jgi:hypothetical protein
MYKSVLLSLISVAMFSGTASPQAAKRLKFLDPTGSYSLITRHTTDSAGVDEGPRGEMLVRLLDSTRVLVGLDYYNGGPGWHYGGFVDTLTYQNNVAVYTCPEDDSTCVLTLYFQWSRVVSVEQTENLNWGCGFGQGVDVTGIFRKVSNQPPENIESNH